MKYRIISHSGSHRLILIFAGWAMDWRPFDGLHRPGYDIAVAWGFPEADAAPDFARSYDEICVIAWSLGVGAAPQVLRGLQDKITLAIAVNGTPSPVDDERGIPEATFRGTLNGLDERNLTKFYRRVAGSRQAFEAFEAHRPDTDIAVLRSELERYLNYRPATMQWDLAIIGTRDAIFPPENMHRAWSGTTRCVDTDDAHLPDFERIINQHVINKDLVADRFAAGRATYDSAATVQTAMTERMIAMLFRCGIELRGARVLEIGSGTGLLSAKLDALIGPHGHLDMIDLAANTPLEGPGRRFMRGDAELLIRALPSGSYDLVISASTVQWFHSPERFLRECGRVVRPGGAVAIGTYVAGNLPQVSELTGAGLPLLSADDWRNILSSDGTTGHFEVYDHTLAFGSALQAFRHLKATGVNSLDAPPSGHSRLRNALRTHRGEFSLTYKALIFLIIHDR